MDMDLYMRMYRAMPAGEQWPPDGIPDTPDNRAMWDKLAAEITAIREARLIPDIPVRLGWTGLDPPRDMIDTDRRERAPLTAASRAGSAAGCPGPRMIRELRALLAEMGCPLPEEVKIRVRDSSAEVRYLVLPQRPPRPRA